MKENRLLRAINSRRIGEYRLQVELRPLKQRSGWTRFSIFMKDRTGRMASRKDHTGEYVHSPVLDGIHSRGGRGIKAWIEVGDYFPIVHFRDNILPEQILTLSGTELDRRLFQIVADLIPPGGHLMLAYDVSYESSLHRETMESLSRNIPCVCTPLGKLLFDVGFRLVKNWYLAEGGCEGPQKLWGEKPPDDAEARRFDRMTFFQVLGFSARRPGENSGERELNARRRAMQVLSELRLAPPLSVLREKVVSAYRECPDSETVKTASVHTCQCVSSFRTLKIEDDIILNELERIARECSADLP